MRYTLGMKKLAIALACLAITAMPATTGAFMGVPVMFPIQAQLEVGYADNGIASPDVPVTVSVTLDMAFAPYKLTVDWGDGATSKVESSSMTLGPIEHKFDKGTFTLKVLVKDSTTRSRSFERKITVQ
jgi:hypothetical protein